MGRQVAVFMTQIDEEMFLEHFAGIGDIVVLETSSERVDGFIKTAFSKEMHGHWQYFIWNKRFKWEPAIKKPRQEIDEYRIVDIGTAPLIEFSRSDMTRGKPGRIYWSKYFSAPDGLNYDMGEFSRWYDSVVRWVKKNAAGKSKYGTWVTYYLPDAWRTYTNLPGDTSHT